MSRPTPRPTGHRNPLKLAAAVLPALLLAAPAEAQLNQTQHTDGWILAAAHAPGEHGSIWRTDLWIAFDASSVPSVSLWFCERGVDNTDAAEHVYDLPGDDLVVYFEDVVDRFLDLQGGSWTGAIHYRTSGPAQVWARVYSVNAEGTASYGQLVEGIPTADMSPDQPSESRAAPHQWLYAMRHTADDRYRVNLGVVNPTAVEGSYELRLFGPDGNDPAGEGNVTRTVTVPPFSSVQLGDPFADMMGGEWSACIVRVIGHTEGTGTFAYASVVDNATNDAWFVRGVKRLRPDE